LTKAGRHDKIYLPASAGDGKDQLTVQKGVGLYFLFARNSKTIIRTYALTVIPLAFASCFSRSTTSGGKNTLILFEFSFVLGVTSSPPRL